MTQPRDYYESCTQLAPGAAAAYEEFHRAVPRRVDVIHRRAGVVSWQIYLRDDVLTHCVGVEDRARMQQILSADPATPWWMAQVKPFLVDGATPPVQTPFGRLIWDLDWPTREDAESQPLD
jgi:L-rhamnose mutarotase